MVHRAANGRTEQRPTVERLTIYFKIMISDSKGKWLQIQTILLGEAQRQDNVYSVTFGLWSIKIDDQEKGKRHSDRSAFPSSWPECGFSFFLISSAVLNKQKSI